MTTTAVLPVTHTVPRSDAVLPEVAAAYPIGRPVSCRLLHQGFNDTYLVTARGGRYVARIYRADWRSAADVAYELELLVHLAGRGVPVSTPLVDKQGRLQREVATAEGTRQLVLFTYARGSPLLWEEEEHCYRAGKLTAAIHNASDDFSSRHPRVPMDLRSLLDEPLAALLPFLAHRAADWNYLTGFAAQLRDRAQAAGAHLDWGVCHGNLNRANIHIAEDGSLSVFDFDLCAPGWRLTDFAEMYWVASYARKRNAWEAFLKGYREARPLGDREAAAVPLFQALRALYFLGLRATRVSQWGSACLSDKQLDWEFRFLRGWEAERGNGW